MYVFLATFEKSHISIFKNTNAIFEWPPNDSLSDDMKQIVVFNGIKCVFLATFLFLKIQMQHYSSH